jgi:hypothetical protein
MTFVLYLLRRELTARTVMRNDYPQITPITQISLRKRLLNAPVLR